MPSTICIIISATLYAFVCVVAVCSGEREGHAIYALVCVNPALNHADGPESAPHTKLNMIIMK